MHDHLYLNYSMRIFPLPGASLASNAAYFNIFWNDDPFIDMAEVENHPASYLIELLLRHRRTRIEIRQEHVHVLNIVTLEDDTWNEIAHRCKVIREKLMEYERNQLDPLPYHIEFGGD